MRNNEKVRKTARNAGVYLWEIGAQLGVSENTVIRWLRMPLDNEKESRLLSAIFEVAERKHKEVTERKYKYDKDSLSD